MNYDNRGDGGFPWLIFGMASPLWGWPLLSWMFSEDGPRWFHAILDYIAKVTT